jgi:flagellar motor switch/type III secretory pathway protein FliN
VNDRLVARGEVLVVHDNFAIRITEIVPPAKTGE